MNKQAWSVIIVSTLVVGLGCDVPNEEQRPPAAEGAAEIDAAQMAEDIGFLRDEGPEADEVRMALPVPAIAIDLHADGTIMAGVAVVDSTEPGGPAKGGPSDRRAAPQTRPDESVLSPMRPRTIFGADGRFQFHDHAYPFRTVGRVDSPKGSCTGTMVGPRHVLTASHCVSWNGDNTVGWLRFRPSLYNAEIPFGEAWSTSVYYYRKADSDKDGLLDATDIAFDFVVVTLDRVMGNSTGFMGSKTYSANWNGASSWANIGYPGDLGGAVRPVFQNPCAVDSTAQICWNQQCSLQLLSKCDVNPGQSGGPLYGTWSGSPSVVGVVSAGNNATNYFAGGSLIPTLINQARAQMP